MSRQPPQQPVPFIPPNLITVEERRSRPDYSVHGARLPEAPPEDQYSRDDILSLEGAARWLKSEVPLKQGIRWVREKCRPRSPNPIPFKNLGKNLVFSKLAVSEWIRNTPRLKHSPHRRRTKAQMKKAKEAA
jgi:hypothetical protein